MSSPFVAEIRIFPFNFAPVGWAMCNGQVLSISQNTALFSLVGTFYGGNGTSNFALPNLQSSAVVGAGQGIGLSPYEVGQVGGSPTVTVLQTQLPQHTHQLLSGPNSGRHGVATPGPAVALADGAQGDQVYAALANNNAMAPNAIANAGGNQPHNNLMPYLTLNFCIAMQGIYPSRG
jgi:microcystin-dependent protein